MYRVKYETVKYVSLRRVDFALLEKLLKTDVQYFIRGKEHFSLEAPRRDKQLFFSYLKNSYNAKLFICNNVFGYRVMPKMFLEHTV